MTSSLDWANAASLIFSFFIIIIIFVYIKIVWVAFDLCKTNKQQLQNQWVAALRVFPVWPRVTSSSVKPVTMWRCPYQLRATRSQCFGKSAPTGPQFIITISSRIRTVEQCGSTSGHFGKILRHLGATVSTCQSPLRRSELSTSCSQVRPTKKRDRCSRELSDKDTFFSFLFCGIIINPLDPCG